MQSQLAFTKHGVPMAANVLNNQEKVELTVKIIRVKP